MMSKVSFLPRKITSSLGSLLSIMIGAHWNSLTICLMIRDTDATLFALPDMSARLTNQSGSEPFFVYNQQDFFLFFDIFFQCLLHDLAKIPLFLRHVDEIKSLVWVTMLKEFVIQYALIRS